MLKLTPTNVQAHQRGAPRPVPEDTPVWVLRAGSSTFEAFRAGDLEWESTDVYTCDNVLAWARVVAESEET